MNPQNPQSVNNKSLVIFDTNVFGYLVDKTKLSEVLNLFADITKSYQITISLITYYELVRYGTKEIKTVVNAVEGFKTFDINKRVLGFAALLYCLGVKSDGDSIIAATSFLNNALILTANQADFPEPFFHETKYWHIDWKNDKNRTSSITVHLLKPDIDKILESMREIEYIK